MDRYDGHDGDSRSDDELAYRSISTPAVVGLALALLSLLAFTTPWLAWSPWVAALVSVVGLRQIARHPETKTGRPIALLGLAVAVATAAAVSARDRTVDRLHRSEAARVADRFLQLIAEGDDVGALELTLPQRRRRADRQLAELYYQNDDSAINRLDGFREDRMISLLTSADPPRPVLIEESDPVKLRGQRVVVSRWYELSGADRGMHLQLERSSALAPGPVSWRVSKHEFADRRN